LQGFANISTIEKYSVAQAAGAENAFLEPFYKGYKNGQLIKTGSV
jgi:hypothetical protein